MPVIIPNIQPDLPQPAVRGRIVATRFNGFETGPGRRWHTRKIKGLDDMPDLTTGDTDRGGMDGVIFGEDREGKKVVEITYITYADGKLPMLEQQDQVGEAIRLFVATFQRRVNDDLPLDFVYENAQGLQSVRTVFCRPRVRGVPYEYGDLQVKAECTVSFEGQDPRVYGPLMEATCGLSLGQGRRGYPRGYPWGYSGGGPGGLIRAYNAGGRDSLPLAIVRGPVRNPRIIHREQGLYVQANLEIGAGDSLAFDFDERTITLNGSASRFYAISGTSDWFALQPEWNTLQYVADFYQPNSTLTLYWRSAD